jgi:hypothetical protein
MPPGKTNIADLSEPPAKRAATGNYSYGYNPNAFYDTFARNNMIAVPAASGDGGAMYNQNMGGQVGCMPYGMNGINGAGGQVKSMSKLTMNIGFGKIMSGATAANGATSAGAQRGYPYNQQYHMHNAMNTYGAGASAGMAHSTAATSSSSYRGNMDTTYQHSAMSLSQSQGHYYPSSGESKELTQQHELQLLHQIQQQTLDSSDASIDHHLGLAQASNVTSGGLTTENVLHHSSAQFSHGVTNSIPILTSSNVGSVAAETSDKFPGTQGGAIPRTYSQQQLQQLSLPPSSNSSSTGNNTGSGFSFGTLSHSTSTASLKKFEEQIPSFDEAMAMLAAR